MASTHSLPPPKIPEDSAAPAEVRKYFTEILNQHYHIPRYEAGNAVTGWRYGTGAAIQRFDAEAYRGIFGAEIGTILYQHHSTTPLFNFRVATNPNKKEVAPDPLFMYHVWPLIFSGIAAVYSMVSLVIHFEAAKPELGLHIGTSVFHVMSLLFFVLPKSIAQEGVKEEDLVVVLSPYSNVGFGLALLSIFHTWVPGFGYMADYREQVTLLLLFLNGLCLFVPVLRHHLSAKSKEKAT